jgi:hypothetical protein
MRILGKIAILVLLCLCGCSFEKLNFSVDKGLLKSPAAEGAAVQTVAP